MYYELRRGSIAVGSTLLLTSDECAASGTASSTSSEYPVCVDGTGRVAMKNRWIAPMIDEVRWRRLASA